jgi:hypothetical protein
MRYHFLAQNITNRKIIDKVVNFFVLSFAAFKILFAKKVGKIKMKYRKGAGKLQRLPVLIISV